MMEEERIKRYWEWVKQNKQNWTFQNYQRKLYQKVGGEYIKTNQQPDAEEINNFGVKYVNRKIIE